jgi:hypothetical protein
MPGKPQAQPKKKRQEGGKLAPQARNGRLAIPLPFEDAVKAAVEAKPPKKTPRKPRRKKPAKR